MVVELLRVFHPQFDLPALAANIRHQLPVNPVLENQGLGVAVDDMLRQAAAERVQDLHGVGFHGGCQAPQPGGISVIFSILCQGIVNT